MEFLPQYFWISFFFILGAILGSFLDVLASRFHTGKSINGRSRCMSCGHTLGWYELIPLFSYVVLSGKCTQCHSHIPLRLLAMELMTGALFVLFYVHIPDLLHLVVALILLMVLIVIARYDIQHMIIPNELVLVVLALAVVDVFIQSQGSFVPRALLFTILSALGVFLFFLSLWLVSKGRWIGLGDVKLAFPLGLMIGVSGALSFVVLSFWVGAGISLALLFLQFILKRGKQLLPFPGVPLTIKSEVPFAPFMIVAFVWVYLFGTDVLRIAADLF